MKARTVRLGLVVALGAGTAAFVGWALFGDPGGLAEAVREADRLLRPESRGRPPATKPE